MDAVDRKILAVVQEDASLSVAEIGQRVGAETPNIDAVFGLAHLFGCVRGLYPP